MATGGSRRPKRLVNPAPNKGAVESDDSAAPFSLPLEIAMPMPGYHVADLRPPGDFQPEPVRTAKRTSGGKTYLIIQKRLKGSSSMSEASYRYPVGEWSTTEARAHAERHKTIAFHPAEGAKAAGFRSYVLDTESETSPIGVSDVQINEHGQPLRRLLKHELSAGIYTHPEQGWTMDVTPERMDRWIAAYRRMREDGIRVESVKDHSFAADSFCGYIVDLFREGDKLMSVHELVGQDAIDLAGRIQTTSIWLELDYQGGNGTYYGEALIHSALVQGPVIPGQDPFVPIPATDSRAASRAPVFSRSAVRLERRIMTNEDLDGIRELLGLDDTLEEAGVLEAVKKHFAALSEKRAEAEKALTQAQGEINTLKASMETDDTPKIDPDLLDERADSAEERIDGLVERAKITPAVAASLKTILVGKPGTRHAYALSTKASGRVRPLYREIIEALEENDPVALGEKTAAQARVLAREVPDEKTDAFSADVNKEMLAVGAGDELKY